MFSFNISELIIHPVFIYCLYRSVDIDIGFISCGRGNGYLVGSLFLNVNTIPCKNYCFVWNLCTSDIRVYNI